MEPRRVNSFAECSKLIMSRMKRGVMTNCFISHLSLKCEIDEGRLEVCEVGESLFILRKRCGFCIMNFYLPGKEALIPEFDFPVVTEIAFRNVAEKSDTELFLLEYLEKCGFKPLLSRVKLERTPGEESKAYPLPEKALFSDADSVYKLLSENLPALTGCVPTISEISADIEKGGVFAARRENAISAVLRGEIGKNSAEIKQLAVSADFRRMGIAKSLLRGFISECESKKITVWTGKENKAAIGLYLSEDFRISESGAIVLAKNV